MTRAQDGDAAAYRLLIGDLYDATAAYLHRVLFDPNVVEDCVQECLLALHRARATYDPRRPFRPWYFTIVRHRARDLMRRQAQSAPIAPMVLHGSAPDASPPAGTGYELERLLRRLRPEYREALELTKLKGFTIDQAATKVGVANGTMKARVHRGLARLAKIVHAESEGS